MIIRNQFGRAAQALIEPTHIDAVLEGFSIERVEDVPVVGTIFSRELTPTEKRIANLAKARAAKAAKRDVN